MKKTLSQLPVFSGAIKETSSIPVSKPRDFLAKRPETLLIQATGETKGRENERRNQDIFVKFEEIEECERLCTARNKGDR